MLSGDLKLSRPLIQQIWGSEKLKNKNNRFCKLKKILLEYDFDIIHCFEIFDKYTI